MKLSYCCFLVGCFAVLQFVSCTTLLEMAETKEPKPAGGSSFIEMKDGRVMKGTTISYPEPQQIDFSKIDFFKRQILDDDWIGIDGQKIPVGSIYGYQDKGLYRALYRDRVLERLEKGRLNLYSFERDVQSLGGNNLYKEMVYVYEKERGQFKVIEDRLDFFYEAIADNANAANLCKELFPYLSFSKMSSSGEKLRRVVGVYNQ